MSTKFMRKVEFKNGEYFHVYNRGVDKRDVFSDERDYVRFIKSMREFNTTEAAGGLYEKYLREKHAIRTRTSNVQSGHLMSTPLVSISAYCLNPNHYHFILKQQVDNGIKKFMQKLGNGYTKYFNHRNKRSGSLFQGVYKSVHIDSNEYFLYLSAYVNKNNFIHGYSNAEEEWEYSSLPDYAGKRNGTLCDKGEILGQFNNDISQYKKFLDATAAHLKEKKELEKYLLEN